MKLKMKKYLKFIFAITGLTLAMFTTILKASARIQSNSNQCTSTGSCGTTSGGENIQGQC